MASSEDVFPTELPDWNNLNVLHKSTLTPRAYFHNYISEADALSYDVNKSKTHSLSGTWKFQLSNSPFEAAAGFEAPSFDCSSWDDIAIPGMWQLQGFGKGPQYTNVKYPIPVDPPNVPFTDNETGSYVKKFKIPESLKGDQIRLRFEGVDSSYHVWVNGKEVGYSQGSRNPDEFDITEFVHQDGGNTLAVRVYQWCDGTYIEDQDQWWLSGIFRDVFLVGFPPLSRVENLHVQTFLDPFYVNAELQIKVDTTGSGTIGVKLLDPQQKEIAHLTTEVTENRVKMWIPVENPLKWTAESPHLYHLLVTLNSEQHISHRIGFRQVEIKDGLLKVNGKRIVFRGVNRHEHHPKYGRTVPLEFLKQDLLLMKCHNINAIRTSHQPNDPRLYDLADEMGFWVMDEADLECHGFDTIASAALSDEDRKLPFRERQLQTRYRAAEWTTNNPEWCDAYVDRAKHLVKRDQLHPSVIVWSLGNEAFFGRNFKAMYEWIKGYDDSRPIHYEADIFAETMDMYSRMYPPLEEVIKFGEDDSKTKPLVLCEFVHAMGNGPGNIQEYIDAFYQYPKLQGGFAWEWANHGLLTRDKQTGEEFYGYGGDFGEEVHDGTFVMDGLVNSDHMPNSGLIEYKKAIEPVRLMQASKSKATFINRYDFVTLDHLTCQYSLSTELGLDGPLGLLDMPSNVGPGQTFDLELPDIPSSDHETHLNLSFQLKTGTSYLEKGFEIATAQIPISTPTRLHKPSPSTKHLAILPITTHLLHIQGGESVWSFYSLDGRVSWLANDTKILTSPPQLTFFRAPTDNDIPQDGRDWKEKLLHLAKPSTRAVEFSRPSLNEYLITVHQRIAPPVLSWSIDCVLTYKFANDGSLRIHVTGTPRGENPPKTLPRIGLVMGLPNEWQRVEWFGRGPGESYRDSKNAQLVGLHTVPHVEQLWTDYEVPQESSNRTDTRWLKLRNGSATLLVQLIEKGAEERRLFDFQASHYRMEDVAGAKHPHELRRKKKEEVILRLDAQHHGLGSGSCGPKTLAQYALQTAPFEFEVLLQCY